MDDNVLVGTRERSRAGGYAWQRHVRSFRPWLIPALLPSFLYPVFVFAFVLPQKVSLWVTLAVSAAMVLAVWLTHWLIENRQDRSWEEGARGEIRVGRELEKLYRDGFYVFHDYYSVGRGNVDHFLVGPPGVFAVETKAHKGEITVRNEEFLQDGMPLKKDPIRQVRGEARDVSQLIKDTCGVSYWVHPIVCFSQAELRHSGPVRNVETSTVGSLRSTIMRHAECRSSKDLLTESEVRAVCRRIENHLGVAPAAGPDFPPVEPGPWRRILTSGWAFSGIMASYILLLSIVFPKSTIQALEALVGMYELLAYIESFAWQVLI